MIVAAAKNRLYSGRTPYHVLMAVFLAGIVLSGGCATTNRIERYQPIKGYWKTNRDIIVSIHNSPEYGIGAFVMKAPGHLGPEAQVDAPVILDIQPRSDYSFEGSFLMPGGEKPVKVQMILTGRNTLKIISRDKRVQNRMMQWQRIRKP